jgi:hypothetical protein
MVLTWFSFQYLLHCLLWSPEDPGTLHPGALATIKKAVSDLPNPLDEIGKAWHNPFTTIGKALGKD